MTEVRRRKKKKRVNPIYAYGVVALFLVLIVAGLIISIKRYSPTKEHTDLAEFFELVKENQVAVILNGEYKEVTEDSDGIYAIHQNDMIYLEYDFVKEYMDDGYVYDESEITLRYATDSEIYTATIGSKDYLVDKSKESLSHDVVLSQDGQVFIACDYLQKLTDFQYTSFENPARVCVETAGWKKSTATLKKKTEFRTHGGVKSPILEDGIKGEEVIILEDYGKWALCLSENGVLGCVKTKKMSEAEEKTTERTLADRVYNHISIGSDIKLGWHQSLNADANASIADTLAKNGEIDVISPTWFYLNNNSGGIFSNASANYVNYCHQNNIQVWGTVSNLEDTSVDTTKVLNTTSSRDALVNNLIAQAITYGLDGISVDIEELSGNAKDGYIQFIRELSIKCEKNDIILSVDNYVPSGSSRHYNRSVQADYVDYVIIMAYDEHYAGSEEPGSTASIGWVEDGVKATLEEVPAEQIILGIPFYCRAWEEAEDGTLSSSIYSLTNVQKNINGNNATVTWSEECGQYYAEYPKDNGKVMIWVEDENSIEEKLKVMDKYGLAGAAFWKLGLGNDSAWNAIAKYL